MVYRRDCFLLCTLILGPAPGFAAETAPAKRNEVAEAALGLARQLCDDLPSDAGALYSLGRVQQRFGDRKAAAASFQQGLDRNPSSGMGAALHRAAGEIAVQANDGRQAVRHFQAALRLTPEDATLYTRLAAGYTLLGDRRQALVRYEQAVARRPDHALFQVLLARACRDAGFGLGVCAADYDNDGDTDLYVTNFGPNVLYRNNGDGTFTDVSAAAGVAHAGFGAGCAFLDIDNDGDLDIVILHSRAAPTVLRNDSENDHHWVQITCRGTQGNRDGIGPGGPGWLPTRGSHRSVRA